MLKNFFKCGLLGWCLEIIFTALGSLKKRDMRLFGRTSLWMFPIYGSLCVLAPLFKALKNFPLILRGSVYAFCIFAGEYLTGSLLRKYEACPWDYSKAPLNIDGLIRLDYAPYWFGAGLVFEKILDRH